MLKHELSVTLDFADLRERLNKNSEDTERALRNFFSDKLRDGALRILLEAEEYSLLGGGKRIRAFLVNEVCRMLGGNLDASMPFAIAVEMIHTYSLIHDDLPCMDDDDMRRGKPSNHKVYGEANALLAGDALLTNAFEAASSSSLSAKTICEAISAIARAAGDGGMIGGQIIDLESEGVACDFESLLQLHSLKTGKMIELSALLGCMAAGYDKNACQTQRLCSYARKIGLAFQAVDDILDIIGDEKIVGKTLHSDLENQKTTFLSFYDIDGVREYAETITSDAIEEIIDMPNSEVLVTLAVYLLNRKN